MKQSIEKRGKKTTKKKQGNATTRFFLILCAFLIAIPLSLSLKAPVKKPSLTQLPSPKNPIQKPKNTNQAPEDTYPSLLLTGEAWIDSNLYLFLEDPTTQINHMLTFTPNPQNNKIVKYQNKKGKALLNGKLRKFELGKPNKNQNQVNYSSYWEGYELGYSLYQPYGEMLPEDENPETGELSTGWKTIHNANLPKNIQDAIWSTPLETQENLANLSNNEKEYWEGVIHGAKQALLGNTNESKLQKWVPSQGEPPITSPRQKTANAGEPFYFQVQAPTATHFEANHLPPGLTLNQKTGEIQGTIPPNLEPEQTIDIYQTIITATNPIGATTSLLEITILPKNR